MRLVALLLGFVVLVLDLLTKWWVQETSWLHNYTVIDGLFRIHYLRNEGIAFGLFHSLESSWKPVILSLLAIIAVLVVLYYIWLSHSDQIQRLVPLGILLGGILGNFVERLSHDYVTDFIEIHWKDYLAWPTFNLADAAISCGVLFLLYQTFLEEPSDGSQDRRIAEGERV